MPFPSAGQRNSCFQKADHPRIYLSGSKPKDRSRRNVLQKGTHIWQPLTSQSDRSYGSHPTRAATVSSGLRLRRGPPIGSVLTARKTYHGHLTLKVSKQDFLMEAPNTPQTSGHLLHPAASQVKKPHKRGIISGKPSGRQYNANLMSMSHHCGQDFCEKRNRIPS